MTFKRFSRAGLLALAGAIVLAILLSVPTFNAAFAEATAAEAPAAVVSCDAKTLTNCAPNSGDTAWMLTSMAIVLMMTIPGLALFYGGMVRKKNVGDTVMTSFAITCLITVLFSCVTYSLAFTGGTAFIGGLSRVFLRDIVSDISKGIGNPNSLAPTIPETVYMCFQMTFAIITPALIAGAFAERMKFSAMLWFIGLWAPTPTTRAISRAGSRFSTLPAVRSFISTPASRAWFRAWCSARAEIRVRAITWS